MKKSDWNGKTYERPFRISDMGWKIVRLLSIAAILVMVTACEKNPDVNVTTTPTGGGQTAVVASISVTPLGPFTLSVRQTQQLSATARDASTNQITGVTFIWSSSNTSFATVSSTGLVTAVAPTPTGQSVSITASSGTVTSDAVSVTVSCAGIPSNTPTPISVVLNPPSPINVNATTAVTATVRDCNGNAVPDNTTVTFSLSRSNLGSLSPSSASTTGGSGVATTSFVAGTNAGSVTITAVAGTVSNSATLVIQALPAGSIKFKQANPQVIGVKGAGQIEVSEVSFSINDTQGNPVSDGSVTVTFQFLNGFNPGGGVTIDPPTVSTLGGIAKTFVKSGYVAGPVRVLAFLDTDNDAVLDTGEIYSTSTPLSVGGGVPSMRFFSVSADLHNLAGLAFDGEVANINVKLADRFGNYNVLQGTSVSFYTEAGAIDRQGVTDENGQTSVVFRTQNRQPIDTDPRQDLNPIGNEILLYNNVNADDRDAIEPFEDFDGDGTYDVGEHFSDLDGGGYNLLEPNPRDGWVSVLAVTLGEETFYDLNGNGLYDTGETFDDNGGEPFIDENDNGLYDDAETFTDSNANNSYDPGEAFVDKSRGEPFLDLGPNSNGTRDSNEPFTDLDGDLTYDSSGFTNRVYDHGEFYVDVNGDGKWTHGNGQWDLNTSIWVDLRRPNQTSKVSQIIAFTGPPDVSLETSRIVIDESHRNGAKFSINNGECADMTIYVADINNNAPIAGTTISLTVTNGLLVGPASTIVGDNSGGEPIVIGAAVCDDDATKIEVKPSSLKVDIAWTPQQADTLTTTLTATGTKDAPIVSAVTITTTSLPNATAACAPVAPATTCYNVTLNATGGALPYTWTVSGGSLPSNFTLNPATGLIAQTGATPSTTTSFTVQATDLLGTSDTQALSITVP